jgi:F-type H+-transporting ATPase subunit b
MNMNLTLIGQSLAFLLFVWTCAKFVWPPLITAMRERQATIAQGLEKAVKAEQDLEQAQQRAGEELEKAKDEARQIIEQARARATQMIEEAKDDARREGERQKEAARAEIEQEANRLKDALRSQVAALAVVGAERVLEASVDQDKHAELLSKLAAEL